MRAFEGRLWGTVGDRLSMQQQAGAGVSGNVVLLLLLLPRNFRLHAQMAS